MRIRSKDLIAKLQTSGEPLLVPESRGENLRWASYQLGVAINTKRVLRYNGKTWVCVSLADPPKVKVKA